MERSALRDPSRQRNVAIPAAFGWCAAPFISLMVFGAAIRTVCMARWTSRRKNVSPTTRASMASAKKALMNHLSGVSSMTSTKRPAMTTQTNSAAIVVNVTATLVRCPRCSSVCLSALAEPLSAGASAASSWRRPAAIDDPRNTAGHHVRAARQYRSAGTPEQARAERPRYSPMSPCISVLHLHVHRQARRHMVGVL